MKNLSYFVVALLLFSSFAIVGIGNEAVEEESINVRFLEPTMKEIKIQQNKYIELDVEGANAQLHHAGKPILPVYKETLTLPFGTKILDVECKVQGLETMMLSDKIAPAPQPVIPGMEDAVAEYRIDENIYNADELFPDNWFSYSTGGGLDENSEHKTFLTIQVYPVRYNPMRDTLSYVEDIDLTITYDIPDVNPLPVTSTYDMVIITPSELYDTTLDDLMEHKNSHDVKTIIKTLDEIYSEYSGVDKPEQIKYFIKNAIEEWGIEYVLLVGGLKSLIYAKPRDDTNQGTKDWLLPVRYTNLRDSGGTYDPGFISDLYYADIYDGESGFSSWDSDKNGASDGIFANWQMMGKKDIIDLYPDVYVGRLACRNVWEVKIMTNKIINYENDAYGSDWYDKMIGIGGDSFDDTGTNYLEGELVAEKILNTYMTEFDPVKIYASYNNSNPSMVPTTDNIIREITKGAGHLFFDGHANPASWITHFPGEFDSWIPKGGIKIYDFNKLRNKGMLPVCCVEGCHNSQFNVSLITTILDKENERHMWTHGLPAPECWSWWLARKIGGGSLATIGNTGLGYGTTGEHGDLDGDGINEPDILEALGGYWFIQFYKTVDEGVDILGEAWGGAEHKFMTTFPGMEDQTDCKTVQQMALLGDPSLKIGGYPPSAGLKARINGAAGGIVADEGDTIQFHGAASDGQQPYTYEWDFDEDGKYDDAIGSTVSHSWNSSGVYWVSLKVTDGNNNVDTYNTVVGIEPGASIPTRPSGSTQIKPGVTYTYTSSISATSWDDIYYKFSWGDGTETDWVDTPSASHSWTATGSYSINVKALLTGESVEESDWSDPLIVSITKNKATNHQPLFLQFLENHPHLFPLLRYILGL